MKKLSLQLGVTLTEMALVLAVGSAMLVSSLRMYQYYSNESNIAGISTNADMLAQAAAYYYYANCRGGTLDPYITTPADNVILNIQTDLRDTGYLLNPIVENPLVNSAVGLNGYTVQLTKQASDKMIDACSDAACSSYVPTKVGTIYGWQIKIGVAVMNSQKAKAIQGIAGADCLTTAKSDGTFADCATSVSFRDTCVALRLTPTNSPAYTQANNAANTMKCPASYRTSSYDNVIVFERMPASAMPSGSANPANSTANQFNAMYNTYSITTLTSGDHTTEFQYFLCGS